MDSKLTDRIDVCISCVAADRIKAEALAEYLRGRGMDCRAGHAYAGSAKVMVLLFSEAAQDSIALIDDINDALAAGATIIPYRMTDKEPSGAMGFYLKPLHWLDAYGRDEGSSREALAELCAAGLEKTGVSAGSGGPEMSLIRKKAAKRKKIAVIAAAALLVLIIAGAILMGRGGGETAKPVRDMSCDEFFEAFSHNLSDKYGDTEYVYMKSDNGEIKYGVKFTDGNGEHMAAIVRFFDEHDNDPESEDSHFAKIGITNSADQNVLTTPKQWAPYLKAFLATLYPEYSDTEISELLGQIYNTKDGTSRIISGTYQLDFTTYEGTYLLEVIVK